MTNAQMRLLKYGSILLTWPALTIAVAGTLLRGKQWLYDGLVIRPGGLGDLVLAIMADEDIGLEPVQFHWLIEKRSAPWAKHLGLSYTCYDQLTFADFWMLRGSAQNVINTEQRFGLAQATSIWMTHYKGKSISFESVHGSKLSSLAIPYDAHQEPEILAFERLFCKATGTPISGGNHRRSRRHPSILPPLVCLAGVNSPTRNIPAATFLNFIEKWRDSSEEITLACTPEDRNQAQKLISMSARKIVLLDADFEGFCRYMASCERVLSVDGGPVHMASYYGIPTTAIFTSGNYKKWAPLANDSAIIRYPDLDCSPCTLYGQTPPCRHKLACHALDYKKHIYKL